MGENIVKCIAVGDGFVGKTCLLCRLTKKELSEDYAPTIFDNSSLNVDYGGKSYEILFIDTAGQEEFSFLRKQAYDCANIFLVCFSVSSITSFSNVKEIWLPDIHNYSKNISKILIGTKSDLRSDTETIDKMNANEEIFVSEIMAKNLANNYNMKYIECSSKTGDRLQEIINTIMELHKGESSKKIISLAPEPNCTNPVLRFIQRVFCCNRNY